MRQITVAAYAYAVDNRQQWPESFDRFAVEYLGQNAEDQFSVFINPREGYLTYQLVPLDMPLDELVDPSATPVLYEMRNDGTIDWNGCVGYADGHVEGPEDRSGDAN